jgi:hypothetical protein
MSRRVVGGAHVVSDETRRLALMAVLYLAQDLDAIALSVARPTFAATDFSAQLTGIGLLRLVAGSAGLALAAQVGYLPLVVAAVALTLIGTAVAAVWLRHRLPLLRTTDPTPVHHSMASLTEGG